KSDAQLGMADAQFGAKDFVSAAQTYNQVLTSLKADDARRTAIRQRLADSYYNAKDYEQALAGYKPLTQSTDAKTAGYALYFSGNALRELKRYPEAAVNYRKLVDNYPQHSLAAKAALRLGDSYADAKDPKQAALAYKLVLTKYQGTEAAKEAQQALTDLAGEVVSNAGNGGASTAEEILHLLPPGPASSNAQLALAQAAFDKSDWNKAVQLAQTALDGNPDKGVAENALYLIGSAKLNNKDAAGASTAFRSLLAKNVQGDLAGQAGLGLTWALLDANKPADAEASARKALAGGAKGEIKERLQLSLGEALLSQKKTKEAAPVFVALQTSTVKDIATQAAYGSSLALEADKQWAAAARSWGKYAESAPDAPSRARAYLHQGLALVQAKSGVAAKAAFDQAVAADPKGEVGARALYESAWAAHDAKQTADEAARWQRLATDFPQSKYAAEAAFQQGESLFDSKSWNDAAAAYRTVTDKFPQSEAAPLAWYKLGSSLYNMKNWDEAATAFDKAATFPKSDVALESSFWAGESLRQGGKVEQARTRYQKFINGAATASKEVKAYLPTARLGLGQALAASNDLNGAVATYEAGLADAQGADAAELNYRLGEVLAQQGKYKEAYTHYLKVVISYRNSQWAPRSQWAAGQALEKTGDKQAAIDMYRQLAQRQPTSDLTSQAQDRLKALGAG
ncbi:MAG: tetratricopeptide repeat protein, partial [Abitibacteriaceae bacterium]|nr:tetratricopeptide repeat protein [Abditibacteriaceae bacterium]